jgi:transcriptional regulator with XRE-family HTH domain
MNIGRSMSGIRRSDLAIDAERRTYEQLARVGREIRAARRARRLTQQQVADRAGVGRMVVSRAECCRGEPTVYNLQAVALAVGRPLLLTLQRDVEGETADAGHLAIQELVLRTARAAGYRGSFELSTRPAEPWRSADVGLRDDARRVLILVECWNTIGDVGAAARSTDRKRAEAEALASALWGEAPHAIGSVWVVRAIAANRALVARYPEIFATRFPSSSARWVDSLTSGTQPPAGAGLIWCDLSATRLFAWRRR